AVHAFALAWHWATACLVYLIALWALRHRGWALLAGVLFAAEPQSVFAVSWTAARNALVSGFFFALAVWAYLRAADRDAGPEGQRGQLRTGIGWTCAGWLAVALAAWLAALFARETAIIFPFVVVA